MIAMNPIFTVGHSTHSLERLLELLTMHRITAVADVRSQPYSRMNPQFNRGGLKDALKRTRTSYVFMGDELGARSDDPDCYDGGRVRYDRLGETLGFQRALDRIADGANNHRIALLCAEKDPLTCHRTILVARHLVCRGIAVQHILANGALESHGEANTRLLQEVGLPDCELFRSRDELLAEAYRIREEEIAYVDPSFQDSPPTVGRAR